jgi:F420-non-reducing hydrogenase small subunit
MAEKMQIAIYWGAACGGCDVSVLDTNEFILDVAAVADIRMWPIAVDGKYKDIEAMEDGELDLSLFNGAVRNSENEHIARLLRQKSKMLIAYGSCAYMGGIPGLANLTSRERIFDTAYLHNPSIEAGNSVVPRPETSIDDKTLDIPLFYRRVYKLDAVVDVDYYLPGCPPQPDQVVGAFEHALCEDCPRTKNEKKITRFYRPWEIIADPDTCLLEQGILCCGVATRSGCGVRCPKSGIPCRGCYGPPAGVVDQGAKLASSVASIVDSKDPEEIQAILAGLPDFTSFAYRYGVAASLLQRSYRQ